MSLRIVDADAHVIENQQTFAYIEEKDAQYTPMYLSQTWGGPHTFRNKEMKDFWLIDQSVYPVGMNNMPEATAESRELANVDARLKHMDELEIDVQVLYPTLFLGVKTEDPEWEYALIRSYNRWLADIWKKSDGRLRWVAIPPLRSSMARVREELEFCKDHGACGIFLVGLECDKQLDDVFFHPLWEIGTDLDMAACFHSGNHSMVATNLLGKSRKGDRFVLNRTPGLWAFHVLTMDGVPEMFPKMRWGFVEYSASWLPYVLHYHENNKNRRNRDKPFDAATMLKRNNLYVACQVSEDLPYLVSKVGSDNLVVGTDYGHNDTAAEIKAMQKIRTEGKLDSAIVDKILDANARALYGLD